MQIDSLDLERCGLPVFVCVDFGACRSLREIDWGSLLVVGMMVRLLFGTSLHVPLLLIERCRNVHFCIFNDPPDARRQSLLS